MCQLDTATTAGIHLYTASSAQSEQNVCSIHRCMSAEYSIHGLVSAGYSIYCTGKSQLDKHLLYRQESAGYSIYCTGKSQLETASIIHARACWIQHLLYRQESAGYSIYYTGKSQLDTRSTGEVRFNWIKQLQVGVGCIQYIQSGVNWIQ